MADFTKSLNMYGNSPYNNSFDDDMAYTSPAPIYKVGDLASGTYDPFSTGVPGTETGIKPPTAKGIDWFGKEGIAIPGIQALTGLAQLGLGKQALSQQGEANRFNQQLARANLANQGSLVSERRGDRFAARQAQAGTGAGTAGYADRLAQYEQKNPIVSTVG